MYLVSDEQIEFILDDIKKRGIEMEDLQLNLLDHICCILEKELNEDDDFNKKYNETIKQFFKSELSEIEEETKLLIRFKNYYQMKRLLYILFILSIGYNIFILSRMGYNFYSLKKWKSDQELMKSVNYSEGFSAFKNKIKVEHPEVLKNNYIFVSFSNNFIMKDDPEGTIDTVFVNEIVRSRVKSLKLFDSLAASYPKNISFIYAYSIVHSNISAEIEANKKMTKNFIYVPEVEKFFYGYKNKKHEEGAWVPLAIIIDTTGKIIYERGMTSMRVDEKLISILKSIQ